MCYADHNTHTYTRDTFHLLFSVIIIMGAPYMRATTMLVHNLYVLGYCIEVHNGSVVELIILLFLKINNFTIFGSYLAGSVQKSSSDKRAVE